MHRSPKDPRRVALAACLALVYACGGDGAHEEAASESFTGAPAAVERRPLAALESEDDGLEALPLEPLFSARPYEPTEAIRRELAARDPAAVGWLSEVHAPAIEATLRALLQARLAGETAPLPAAVAEARLELPGRGAGSDSFSVEVEAISCEPAGEGRWSATCRVALARQSAARSARADVGLVTPGSAWDAHEGSAQRTWLLDTVWQLAGDGLTLASLTPRADDEGARAVVADGTLFEDRTRHVFGSDVGFEEELLRGPDAYYFHSDRLTGYDLICNQGLAVGDLDGDGREDVFVGMPPGLPNRLYLAQPDGSARDVAGAWRVAFLDSTRSALILDLDGDGLRDLAMAVGPDIVLAWGAGDGIEGFSALAVGGMLDVFGMSAADPDQDGDLDLYACRYSSQGVMQGNPTPYHDAENGAPNTYWRNEGGRKFVDATAEVGLDAGNTRYSFASQWEDYDDDGDLDLYVANDFGRNHYWRNDGGRFTDVADALGAADMAAGMGVASGDVDGDGRLDLYVSNIYAAEGLRVTGRAEEFLAGRPEWLLPLYQRHARGNTLLMGRADGTFEDASVARGANRGGWAWGAQLFDVDNDGDLDVYSPNGFVSGAVPRDADEYFWRQVIARSPPDDVLTDGYRDAWKTMQYLCFESREGWNGDEGNVLLLGDGGGGFVDASAISGADLREDSRSVVPIDWDRDGFLDLLVKSRGAPRLRLLRNRGAAGAADSWLVLELVDGGRDAIGAHAWVETERGTLRRGVVAGDGFLAQSPSRLHFGLGAASAVTALEVRWSDGTRERIESGLEPGRAYRIVRGAERAEPLAWEPVAAVAAADAEPLAELPGFAGRTVLCTKLPMAPVPLPAFDAPARKVADLAASPLLVTIWKSGDAAAEGQLRRLANAREHLEAAGLQVVPLALDSGASLARARALVRELGLDTLAGYADGWTLRALEVLLLEVYHRAETNPIPTSLLLDRAGQLCVVYQGPVRTSVLLEDVATLSEMDPKRPGCARLARGRWFQRPPQRDPDSLSKVFASLAYNELAAFYRQFAGPR